MRAHNNKRILSLLLVFLVGLIAIGLVYVAVRLVLGEIPMAISLSPSFEVSVQAPPQSDVGQTAQIQVEITNLSDRFIKVNRIALPKSILQHVAIEAIVPSNNLQEDLGDAVGYPIDFLIEPKDKLVLWVVLRGVSPGMVQAELQVDTDMGTRSSAWRMDILPAATHTPTLTPTFTQLPTWTLTPTATEVLPTPTPTNVLFPYQALVRITTKPRVTVFLIDPQYGSGSIISPDGYILTNAHVVTPPPGIEVKLIRIGITTSPEEAPVDRYLAEIVEIDKVLDIAVLHIISTTFGTKVDPQELNLPYVPLGDSDTLQLGDEIFAMGYPVIGGLTLTLSRGEVSGFTPSNTYGPRGYIKTTMMFSGGMSGGMILDRNGFLVGIPTEFGTGKAGLTVDCRPLADTNMDGEIDRKDTCIPVGGFVNAFRPINLALPLIEAAMGHLP